MRSSIKVRRTINGTMSRVGTMAIQEPSEKPALSSNSSPPE